MPGVQEISVQDWQDRAAGGWPHTFLDVRRDDELELARFPEPVLHIEMSQVAGHLAEIPRDVPVVVACRSGGRSAKVAAMLTENGFDDVYNLQGGILAWLAEQDTAQLPKP